MQTIGERLEEARKKRAVTLTEAAKVTKIREEYLSMLEKNDGRDIPLEAIYVRGFIRNYAKFLRLEPSKLLADFDASTSGGVTGAPKIQKELIGRLELGTEVPQPPTLAQGKEEAPQIEAEAKKRLKIKLPAMTAKLAAWILPVGIGFVAVLLLTGVIAGIASLAKPSAAKTTAAVVVGELKLTALGDVTVIAKQLEPEQTLFAGTLRKGEEKILRRHGGVQVQYSEGNLLTFEKDGKRIKIGSSGAGKRVLE